MCSRLYFLISVIGALRIFLSLCSGGFFKFREASTLETHSSEYAAFFSDEIVRSIKLRDVACIKDDQAVVINDSPKTMRNYPRKISV